MIVRTYHCGECDCEFEFHCESNDGDPDCPMCERLLDWRPKSFAITGTKARAIDVTQKILEQDYGLSNFKDNTREGETVAMMPTAPNTTEREAGVRAMSEMAQHMGAPALNPEQAHAAAAFWGGTGAGASMKIGPNVVSREAMVAGAAQQTALATAEGRNPMALLHEGAKKGHIPSLGQMTRIIARSKG